MTTTIQAKVRRTAVRGRTGAVRRRRAVRSGAKAAFGSRSGDSRKPRRRRRRASRRGKSMSRRRLPVRSARRSRSVGAAAAGSAKLSAIRAFLQGAFTAGTGAGREYGADQGPHLKARVQQLWGRWLSTRPKGRCDWGQYRSAVARFMQGFTHTSGIGLPRDWMLAPTDKTVAAVITVMNEEASLPSVIEQLYRLSLDEVIFIVNGSRDQSFRMIRSLSPAIVAHYPQPLGFDVGRAVGAKLTRSDIVLFLDGDFPVLADHLLPFIEAADRGVDLVLNDISPYIGTFSERDAVTVMKQFVNRALGRDDLTAASLTAIPHALSRKALDAIGAETLAVPPKAQAIALRKGMVVECSSSVDVIAPNRIRKSNAGDKNGVAEMIIGDHLEALRWVMNEQGSRITFHDCTRHREFAGGGGL